MKYFLTILGKCSYSKLAEFFIYIKYPGQKTRNKKQSSSHCSIQDIQQLQKVLRSAHLLDTLLYYHILGGGALNSSLNYPQQQTKNTKTITCSTFFPLDIQSLSYSMLNALVGGLGCAEFIAKEESILHWIYHSINCNKQRDLNTF